MQVKSIINKRYSDLKLKKLTSLDDFTYNFNPIKPKNKQKAVAKSNLNITSKTSLNNTNLNLKKYMDSFNNIKFYYKF